MKFSTSLRSSDGSNLVSGVFCQAFWWIVSGCEEEGSTLPVGFHRCAQPAVFGLFPVPVLRLHVPCYHLRRTAGRSHRGTHSKNT